MSLGRKIIVAFCLFSAIINLVKASESENLLNKADVYFDVKKIQDNIYISAKENGLQKFSTNISSRNFENFTDTTQNNFYLTKLRNNLLLQYHSETGGFFEVIISLMGDMEFASSAQTNSEFNKGKTYGFKTDGTIVNRGAQAFGNLIASANQIHNFGTIQSNGLRLFHNYMFNSGVVKFGESPKELLDLSLTMPTNSTAQPVFKNGVVENYGTWISNGKHNIKDSLQYHEYGTSDFENLEMFGGGMKLSGRTNVRGTLQGSVSNMTVNDNARFSTGTFNIAPIQHLSIGKSSELFINNKSSLTVSGNYSNSGAILSGSNLTLKLKKKPNDVGLLVAKELLEYICEEQERAKNSIAEHEANQKTQFKGKLIAKKTKITHHTDHYLNTITDHYKVTQDQNGREVSRVFSHRTETGYVWQKRTTEVKEFIEKLSQEITDHLDNKAKEMEALKAKLDELNKIADALQGAIAESNRGFYSGLLTALTRAEISNRDLSTLYGDRNFTSILDLLRNWNMIPYEKQEQILTAHPEISGAIETMEDLRKDAAEDRTWWQRMFCPTKEEALIRMESAMHNPVDEFVMKHPEFLLGPVGLIETGFEMAGVAVARNVLPKVLAMAGINQTWENFTNYMKGGKDAVKSNQGASNGPKLEPQKERVVETKQTQQDRWEKMKQSGEWKHVSGKGKPTLENKKTGEFAQKSIEKWDIEVYNSNEYHIGVIRPSEGFIRKELAVKGRPMRK